MWKCGWVDIQPLSGHLTQNLLNTRDSVKFHTETEWKHHLQHNRVPDSTWLTYVAEMMFKVLFPQSILNQSSRKGTEVLVLPTSLYLLPPTSQSGLQSENRPHTASCCLV